MKKSVIAITLAIGLASFYALAASTTMKVGMPGFSETLDPHGTIEPTGVIMYAQVYEPLVRLMTDEITPILAKEFKMVDPKTYLFTLREGVTFHEGEPLTADDVIFSVNRAKNGASKSTLEHISDVKALDKYTVQITLTKPDPVFLRKLSYLMIMPASWTQKHKSEQPNVSGEIKTPNYANNHQNGTGPFKLVSREMGVKTVYERNDSYWDKANVISNIDRLEFYPIINNATRTSALLSGEIQFTTFVPPPDLEEVKASPGIKTVEVPPYSLIVLALNTTMKELPSSNVKGKNPFADKRVRQAIDLALPMQLIIEKILRDTALLAGNIVPPSVYGYNKTLDIRPAYDEKKAKALLTEAGYPNGFSATLPCLATGEFVCNVVAGTLAKVGISITVDVVPIAKALADARSGKAEMGMVLFFYSNFDVGMGLQDLFHSNGSRNFGMYSNPELDKIIDAQSVEIDPSKRLTMINQALDMIKEDAPKPVMFFPVFYFGMQDNVDIKMNKLSLPLFRDVKINHQ